MAEEQYNRVLEAEPEGQKRVQVWQMFDRIAPTYDLVNRLLSFNLDVRWRKQVHSHLPQKPDLRLLDLATGTGDQVISMMRAGGIGSAVGMDMSTQMLAIGREKVEAAGLSSVISMEAGDATALPFEDASFDAVTISFGIRNVVHFDKALAEMRRILRPGGRAIILEFSLPRSPVVRLGHLFYLRYVLPLVGGVVSGDWDAYRYLNTTIEAFPYGEAFAKMMRDAGFERATPHPVTFGIATIYVGEAAP